MIGRTTSIECNKVILAISNCIQTHVERLDYKHIFWMVKQILSTRRTIFFFLLYKSLSTWCHLLSIYSHLICLNGRVFHVSLPSDIIFSILYRLTPFSMTFFSDTLFYVSFLSDITLRKWIGWQWHWKKSEWQRHTFRK